VHAIQCETAEELPKKMKEFLGYHNSQPVVMVCQVDEEEELYPIVCFSICFLLLVASLTL
ncbi:hypothetical protein PLEOSDRAFT_1035045, partial [Pleurotus ostreatus PC15]